MANGFQNLLVRGLGLPKLLGSGLATLLRDPHKAVSSIVTVTILCLMVFSAPQANDEQSNEIIESDFTSEPDSDDETPREPFSNLPATEPTLDGLPAALIDDRPPEVSRREGGGSSGRDVAGRNGTASNGSGGGNSGGGNSGGESSGGESSGGESSGGESSGGRDDRDDRDD